MHVKVSGKSLRQMFHECDVEYVSTVCHGRCCEGSKGILVTVHPLEVEKYEALGAVIQNGFIEADGRGLCPFKTDDGRCATHEDKPFGCRASPFTLTKKGTLIIRNRYRLLRCYSCDNSKPAYSAHRWSLEQIFGAAMTDKIVEAAAQGVDDIEATMDDGIYQMLLDNDVKKHERKQLTLALDTPST